MVVLRVTVASLWIALGACSVGEIPIGGDGGGIPATKAGFDAMIKPLVMQKGCLAAAPCHGGTQPPNFASFEMLDVRYKMPPGANNILVIKGDAMGGMHSGIPYFTGAEKTTVTNWIDGK